MSIEKNIERIAIALEKIASFESGKALSKDRTDNVAKAETAIVGEKEQVEVPKAAPAKLKSVPPPPKKKTAADELIEEFDEPGFVDVEISLETLNKELVAQCKRLGGRQGVDKIMHTYGVQSLTQLDKSKYSQLLTDVKALKS